MNALQIAIFNRNLAKSVYETALMAHANQQWDKTLGNIVDLAAQAYRDADDEVMAAPGYFEWVVRK